ncbi:unnamed protein product [Symbiodinium pilosum]|uniref:Uncharacterized protein n=1 Tax=Symbiodinium pilosum TaxID=2952 RepID=A0A812THR2_SYMPI|nr:unnamed protein product [Symbiodinium pilosum]
MSYIPAGRPEGGLRDIWVSGKVGDSRARCLATSLHQKGHEVTLIGVKKASEAPIASWGEVVTEQPRKSIRQQASSYFHRKTVLWTIAFRIRVPNSVCHVEVLHFLTKARQSRNLDCR